MSDDRQVFNATEVSGHDELHLQGELDGTSLANFTAALASLNGSPSVTLDVSELTFVDSSGLHALAAFATSRAGTVTLKNPSPFLVRLLEIVGFDEIPNLRIDGAA